MPDLTPTPDPGRSRSERSAMTAMTVIALVLSAIALGSYLEGLRQVPAPAPAPSCHVDVEGTARDVNVQCQYEA